MRNIFRTDGLRTSNLVHCWSTKTRITNKRRDLQGQLKGQDRDDTCCVCVRCWPISRERNVLEIPKLVGRLPTIWTVIRTSFKVKRSKIKVTRSTNAESGSASYLPNWKAYELQTWYTDGAWRAASQAVPWPLKSKVMVTRSRGPSDRCWPISRERKVPETAKLVGSHAHATNNNVHQFQGQKVEGQGHQVAITAQIKSVSYVPNGKAYELQSWYVDVTAS